MQGAYLGPEYGPDDVLRTARRHRAPYRRYDDFAELSQEVANLLTQGQVVGWFQGRMEFGPRALGNRSILGDPRHPEMQKRLNLKIKYREGFRPFAPSVLHEETATYFDLDRPSPYMLLVAPVKADRRNPLPDGYENLDLFDRLYHLRSDVPAITHVDYSARIQTVHQETNERYWRLIHAFKDLTGCGLIVNTSFNVRGEPIVCTPDDAYQCFMRTEMDYLVLGDFVFTKTDQPAWQETGDWRTGVRIGLGLKPPFEKGGFGGICLLLIALVPKLRLGLRPKARFFQLVPKLYLGTPCSAQAPAWAPLCRGGSPRPAPPAAPVTAPKTPFALQPVCPRFFLSILFR